MGANSHFLSSSIVGGPDENNYRLLGSSFKIFVPRHENAAEYIETSKHLNSGSGVGLQYPATNLIAFDGFKKSFKISFAKAVITLSLNKFKEYRPDYCF
ncbi:MAG: hypothetical protein ACI9GW_003134 [Halieaceae bacterium]|jgi:hypothetical protein